MIPYIIAIVIAAIISGAIWLYDMVKAIETNDLNHVDMNEVEAPPTHFNQSPVNK